MSFYKVVTSELESLGLRKNPNVMVFSIGQWVCEKEPKLGKSDIGGIWVCRTKSRANELRRYMKSRWEKDVKVFTVDIGNILYSNSYRVKTDRVKLLLEVKE